MRGLTGAEPGRPGARLRAPPPPPGPPGQAPPRPLPGSDYSAAGPPQQPQCRSRPPRPAPRAAVRPERRPLLGGLCDPPLAAPPGPRAGGEVGSGLKRGAAAVLPAPPALRPTPSPSAPVLLARAARPAPLPGPYTPLSASAPPPAPALPRSGSGPSELGLRPSAGPGSWLSSLLCHPSPRGAVAHQDPHPSATHSFREARPSSAQDRLPDQLGEGPESGVTLCTPPRDSPKATPRIPFGARVARDAAQLSTLLGDGDGEELGCSQALSLPHCTPAAASWGANLPPPLLRNRLSLVPLTSTSPHS